MSTVTNIKLGNKFHTQINTTVLISQACHGHRRVLYGRTSVILRLCIGQLTAQKNWGLIGSQYLESLV